MSELFDIKSVKQDSPRFAWMKHYGVKVKNCPDVTVGDEGEFGNEQWPWYAFAHEASQPEDFVGGETEDEALANFAKSKNLRLWNETNSP